MKTGVMQLLKCDGIWYAWENVNVKPKIGVIVEWFSVRKLYFIEHIQASLVNRWISQWFRIQEADSNGNGSTKSMNITYISRLHFTRTILWWTDFPGLRTQKCISRYLCGKNGCVVSFITGATKTWKLIPCRQISLGMQSCFNGKRVKNHVQMHSVLRLYVSSMEWEASNEHIQLFEPEDIQVENLSINLDFNSV
jgi:hypothetical protein